MERGQIMTKLGKRRGRNRSTIEALEQDMSLSKTISHPYSKHRFYISCTFELCVHLRTYDAMQAQPRLNTLRKMTLNHGIMHDTIK